MDELYYAFVDLMEATQARDKAKAEYQGYSWGWAGENYEDSVRQAKKRYVTGFREAVREIVAETLDDDGHS